MKTATDYESIFKDRVLYITGTGRSGTTILGKVLSSMRPVYYLFEPAILRLTEGGCDAEAVQSVIFEDYFLPQIQGRGNPNPNDWTYWGNAFTQEEMEWKWKNLPRRRDAVAHILEEKPLWVIKNPEAQPHIDMLKEIFPGIRFIHLIRNGLDVVSSNLERGWFTDDYQPVDWIDDISGAPWYVDGETHTMWDIYNQATRAAAVWRCTTEIGIDQKYFGWRWLYEGFRADPLGFYDALRILNVTPTALTESHLEGILSWEDEDKPVATLDDIMEPERTKFKKLMEVLGY